MGRVFRYLTDFPFVPIVVCSQMLEENITMPLFDESVCNVFLKWQKYGFGAQSQDNIFYRFSESCSISALLYRDNCGISYSLQCIKTIISFFISPIRTSSTTKTKPLLSHFLQSRNVFVAVKMIHDHDSENLLHNTLVFFSVASICFRQQTNIYFILYV